MAMHAPIQGEYYDHQRQLNSTSSTYVPIMVGQDTVSLGIISSIIGSWFITKTIALEPVYVKKENGGETLVYNSNMMNPGKQYPVTWNGEHYLLIKNQAHIDIYKFYPGP